MKTEIESTPSGGQMHFEHSVVIHANGCEML